MKKIIAVLLSVAMLMGIVPVMAADGNGKTIALSISFVDGEAQPISSASNGDDIYAAVNFSGNPTEVADSVQAFDLYFNYDSSKLNPGESLSELADPTINMSFASGIAYAGWANEKGITKKEGMKTVVQASGTLFYLGFKAKTALSAQDLASVVTIAEGWYDSNKQEAMLSKMADGTPKMFTLSGVSVSVSSVELEKTSVEVNGLQNATVTVAAKSVLKNPVSAVSWSVSYNGNSTSDVSYSDGKLTVSKTAKAGAYTVTATGTGAVAGKASATLTVTRAAAVPTTVEISGADSIQIPTSATPKTEIYSATVKDQYGDIVNQTVTWSKESATATGVSLDGSTVSVAQNATEGNFVIKATAGGKSATKTISIVNKPKTNITLVGTKSSVTYGDSSFTITASASQTGGTGTWTWNVEGDTNAIAITPNGNKATVNVKAAGTAASKITVKYEDSKYIGTTETSFTVAKKTVAPTFNGKVTKVYDGTTSFVTDNDGTLTIVQPTGMVNASVKISSFGTYSSKNAGTGTMTVNLALDGDGKSNYQLASSTASVNTEIAKKPITVTADNKTVKYSGSMPELTYQTTPALISGDSFTGTLATTATLTKANAGKSFDITQGTLSAGNNYAITFNKGTFKVTDKDSTTVSVAGVPATVTYGDADFELTATAGQTGGTFTWKVEGDTNAVALTPNGNKATVKVKAAGASATKITVSYEDENYAGTDNKSFTVAKKTVAPTFEGKITKIYDGTTAFVTGNDSTLTIVQPTGMINASVKISSFGTYSSKNAGTGTMTVNLALDGTGKGNYQLASSTASVNTEITKKPITVTAEAKSVRYGTAIPELTYQTVPALCTGDSFTGALSTKATQADIIFENIGNTYDILVGTLSAGDNYEMSFVPAKLTVADKDEAIVSFTEAIADSFTFGDKAFTVKADAKNKGENGKWSFESSSEKVLTVDALGNVTIVGAGEATITVKYESDTTMGIAEKTVIVNKAKSEHKAPELTSTLPTGAEATDGTVSGATADMEWSRNNGTSWEDCTGEKILGLGVGSYLFRYKATDNFLASEITTVTLKFAEVQLSGGDDENPVDIKMNAGVNQSTLSIDNIDLTSLGDKEVGVFNIDVSEGVAGQEIEKVELSQAVISNITNPALDKNNIKGVKLATANGAITLNKNVLSKISEVLTGGTAATIGFDVIENDKLEEEQQKTIESMKNVKGVFDIYVVLDGERAFSEGTDGIEIEVRIMYELQQGENGKYLKVYYLKPDGTKEKVDASWQDGFVTTKLKHLSNYVLAYEKTSSGGGGGGSVATYPITALPAVNGTVKINSSMLAAGKLASVTVTPNAGYKLGSLLVSDAKNTLIAVSDNGNGNYSFTMPASAVTVSSTFTAENEETASVKFTDVESGSFYEAAVEWAVKAGITTGTADTTFSPYANCTRAQMITFIWRANGSPEPTLKGCSFTDVDTGAYYYKAMLWGVENGIVKGTTETTFSPEQKVTRAQTVTLLWRAKGSSEPASTAAKFKDVVADAYYIQAVEWALSKEITTGTSETTFSPYADCTRAQIVTFLYRAYK